MEVENKLDADYLFYLGFIGVATESFKSNEQFPICQAWLDKLCGEVTQGIQPKRNRNIYLSNLILCMQDGQLTGPFSQVPPSGELKNATEVFGPAAAKDTSWSADISAGGGDEAVSTTADGRTYLATKALPDGKGALGYIAVSLDEGPLDMKEDGLDAQMERKFKELVPPMTDMERILINRNNPEERQRTIKFYEGLLKSLAKEMDGLVPPGSNAQIAGLINQLESDLRRKGIFGRFETLPGVERQLELMYLLDTRLRERINHIRTREAFLDHVEQQTMSQSFWESSLKPEDIYKEDKHAYAVRMWEQAITAGPKKKLMDTINEKYPHFVLRKYLELLANAKEKIAVRIQRRHENIVSQLKKELRKEGRKGRKKYEDTKYACDEVERVYQTIKDAENRALESRQKRHEYLYGHRKERNEMYEQMRKAMLETQQYVEEEAELGKYLTEQINDLNAKSEVYQHVNEESILKIEDANMAMMKNIQRLNKAVRQHETRISTMKQLLSKPTSMESGSQFFFM